MMPQDFEFFVIPEQHDCYNCKVCNECAASSFLAGCDRWNKGPAYKRNTKEYLKLLCDTIQTIKYEEIQMPPITDPDGCEYYTTIFLMEVF